MGQPIKSSAKRFVTNRIWLFNAYWHDELFAKDIAKKLKIDAATVHRWMKKLNIPIRNKAETNRLKIKRNPALRQPAWKPKEGERSPNWRGGEIIAGRGYIYVYCPNHPTAPKKKYVLKHRLIMEKHLGRYLSSREVVHHINGNHFDNRLENLRLYPSQKEHMKLHKKGGRND